MAEAALREDEPLDAPVAPAPAAPVDDALAPPPAPSSEVPSDLDSLLEQFDREIGSRASAQTSPRTEGVQAPTNGASGQPVDEIETLLSQLGEQQRQASEQASQNAVEQGQLQSERDGWQQAALQANQALQWTQAVIQHDNDMRDVERIAADLQARLPAHVRDTVPDYAKMKLMAVNDPAVQIAFDNRYKSPVALSVELDQAKALLVQAIMKGSEQAAHWQQRVQYLAIAVQSQQIIQSVKNKVIEEARAVKPPVDPDLTYDYHMVAQAVKTAGAKMPAEKAPYLGNMSEGEFSAYKRQFGF